jgi:hypothetical protein
MYVRSIQENFFWIDGCCMREWSKCWRISSVIVVDCTLFFIAL